MKKFSLTFSLAEQSFSWTRSIGLLNLSMGMLEHLARRPEISRVTLLSNDTFKGALNLPEGVETCIHNEANGRGLSRMFWDQWKVYSIAKETSNEWLFMPKGFISFIRKCPLKLAAYVPDVMFDYYERTYPNDFSKLENFYLKNSVKAALRQAKVIFSCSEFTNLELRRVAKSWGITPPMLVAIGTGFSHVKPVVAEKQNRIVVIASPWRHKRFDLALEFLQRWHKETKFDGKMDFIGSLPKGTELPKIPGWELHQRVPEEKHRRMIAEARALVNFTEYEGFGMPPVEAIIAGTCSVYSDIPVAREVLDGTGAPFLNQSYESFVAAMDKAFKASPEQLKEWSRKLQQMHNWEKGAEKIISAMLESDAKK